MTSRQVFSENEKTCLKELVVKYKLHKSSGLTAASQSMKRVSWRRLTEDFNSIETNTKRTEAQLKKLYDNLKTRQRITFLNKARCRRRLWTTVREPYNPNEPQLGQANTSTDPLKTEPICDLTDGEIRSVINCDRNASADITTEEVVKALLDGIPQPKDTPLHHDTLPQCVSPLPEAEATLTRASMSPLQGSINMCSKVIEEELRLKQIAHEKKERREDELHKIIMKEKEWMVMAAEETYFKARAERDAAHELLCCRRAERKLAEYELKHKSKNDEI